MYRKYEQIFAPGNTCTSTILGGRISQRAMDGSVGSSTWARTRDKRINSF
ncbi:MAG: hypothetical protein KAJ32_05020 [Gammaproteobacteria bacterium]|nr:hypothetical protein [Gammaproteobacteria bacterium]